LFLATGVCCVVPQRGIEFAASLLHEVEGCDTVTAVVARIALQVVDRALQASPYGRETARTATLAAKVLPDGGLCDRPSDRIGLRVCDDAAAGNDAGEGAGENEGSDVQGDDPFDDGEMGCRVPKIIS